MTNDYIKAFNKEYGTQLTGVSPRLGNKVIPNDAARIVIKDFGNGLGHVLYVDPQNRLIADNMEAIEGN